MRGRVQTMKRRRFVAPSLAKIVLPLLLVSVMAGGCEALTSDADSSTKKAEAKPEVYDKITDGTWDYGDFPLRTPIKPDWNSHMKITVTGPPTLTTTDGGQTIRMSSPLTFERVSFPEFEPKDEPLADSEVLHFSPGVYPWGDNWAAANENYGSEGTKLKCKSYPKLIGEKASCVLSFESSGAGPKQIKNSHWVINGENVAAWPGQKRKADAE